MGVFNAWHSSCDECHAKGPDGFYDQRAVLDALRKQGWKHKREKGAGFNRIRVTCPNCLERAKEGRKLAPPHTFT